MLRIGILDDQEKERLILRSAIDSYFADKSYNPDISEFAVPLDFLQSLDKGGYDLVLLDICMPGMNGIDVAREVRKRKESVEIVFLTTSDEFAVEAFSLKAAHYVIKPYSQEQFAEAMDRAMHKLRPKDARRIVLQSHSGAVLAVDAGSIMYVESQRAYRSVYLEDGEVINENRSSLAALKDELDKLCPGQFIIPYRGYIVNYRAIRSIISDSIELTDGSRIQIKSGDFRKLREGFFAWSFSREGDK